MKKIFLLNKIIKKLYAWKEARFIENNLSSKKVVNFRGVKFFAGTDNKLEKAIMDSKGVYDWANFQLVEKLVKQGDVCFDIGANIGIYSMVLSRITGDSSKVHSFEPVNHIRNRLNANKRINGFEGMSVNDFALGEEAKKIEMLQVKEGVFRGGTSTFIENENIDSLGKECFEKVFVDVLTLDDYMQENKITKLDFVKIDVEGYEWNVLYGGQKTLKKYKPIILFEYDVDRNSKIAEVLRYDDFFSSIDYTVYEFFTFGEEVVLRPFDFSGAAHQRNLVCLPK